MFGNNNDSGNNGFYMPVAPAYGGGYGNGGGFGFGGDWAWILLLLLLGGNGWGFGGFGGMMGAGMMGMDYLYPWLNNSQNINGGFRDQQLSTQIGGIQNSITSGFGDVQNSLCGGFAGVNATINGTQAALSQQMYTNQIADLERSYAAQTANTQGLTALQSQLAQCCCDNRAGIADLRYTVATENCADRYEASQNTQAIIAAVNAGIQSLKDDLCADRLAASQRETEAERRENANLRSQLSMAQLAASQTAQNAFISQGFANEVDALYNRLNNCPVATVPVYGRQPIFSCGNGGTGCGCGNVSGF